MGTALQKPWMKDLAPPVVKLAKAKAVEATQAWNNTVIGILRAAKAIWEVRERIGGRPWSGAFSAWAEEELRRSKETASCLATIGGRYAVLFTVVNNLPPSWRTLYELAKQPDPIFKLAVRRIRAEMARGDVMALVLEIQHDRAAAAAPAAASRSPSPAPVRSGTREVARPAPSPTRVLSSTPRDAARQLTINWKGELGALKDLAADTQRDVRALSPEAKKFLMHNYIHPMQKILEEVVACLQEK